MGELFHVRCLVCRVHGPELKRQAGPHAYLLDGDAWGQFLNDHHPHKAPGLHVLLLDHEWGSQIELQDLDTAQAHPSPQ